MYQWYEKLLWHFSLDELVKPLRPETAPEPGIDVYVGGVPSSMSSFTTLYGCLRGLKIGKTVFKLQKTAQHNDCKWSLNFIWCYEILSFESYKIVPGLFCKQSHLALKPKTEVWTGSLLVLVGLCKKFFELTASTVFHAL